MRAPGYSAVGLVVCAAALLSAVGGGPVANQRTVAIAAGPGATALQRLPIGLKAAVSATLGAERQPFRAVRRHGSLVAHGGGLETVFRAAGPSVQIDGRRLSLRFAGLGRGSSFPSPRKTAPVATGSRVSYRRGPVTEWYLNGPLGLEQGFTLTSRPAGYGPLTLAIRTAGVTPAQSGPEIMLGGLSYGGLHAFDAAGESVPASLELEGRTLLLRVHDRGARYPLTVDPFLQQAKLTPRGGGLGEAVSTPPELGWSVALSSGGNTALVGAPGDRRSRGAAWVFVRSGSTWSQQGGKLLPNDESGAGRFGASVALSASGGTALIGGSTDNGDRGAVWSFVRARRAEVLANPWRQQGGKLTPNDGSGASAFGASVALSADASTALIGGPSDNAFKGAAWVFTRTGSTWSQQGGKLTPNDGSGAGAFGAAVALSADGSQALIGGPLDDGMRGAVWRFSRLDSIWGQDAFKLRPADGAPGADFGRAVALSADGAIGLIGSPGEDGTKGVAWAIEPLNTVQRFLRRSKLAAGDGAGAARFGSSVALSADGSTALVGGLTDNFGRGAAWTFTRSDPNGGLLSPPVWTQQGNKVTPSDDTGNGQFGQSAALSANRSTALVGGHANNGFRGAAWVFVSEAPAESVAPPPPLPPATPPRRPPRVDTQAPTAPGAFRARYARGKLVLRWIASKDSVGVTHYLLFRGGRLVRRIAPGTTTTSLRRFRTLRRTMFTLRAVDAAGNRSAPAKLSVTPRRRPAGVPRAIPRWAQRLYAWETGGRKGARPPTPKPLSTWYARWKGWRLQPYTFTS